MKKLIILIFTFSMVLSCLYLTKNYINAYETDSLTSVFHRERIEVINPVSNCYTVVSEGVITGPGGPGFAFDGKDDSHWNSNIDLTVGNSNYNIKSFKNKTVTDFPEFSEIVKADENGMPMYFYIGGSFDDLKRVDGFSYKAKTDGAISVDGIKQWGLYVSSEDEATSESFKLLYSSTFFEEKDYEHLFDFGKTEEFKHFRIVVFTYGTRRYGKNQCSASEIKMYTHLEKECINYYDFDKIIDGNMIEDKVGNRNGVLQGTATIEKGIVGNALYIGDKSSEESSMTFLNPNTLGEEWTISYWINTVNEGYEFMSADKKIALRNTVSDQAGGAYVDGQRFNMSCDFERNRWYHVACTYDKTHGFRLFVNGAKLSANTGGRTNDFAAPIDIVGGDDFIGYIDNLKVYDFSLAKDTINSNQVFETVRRSHAYDENIATGKKTVALFEGGSKNGWVCTAHGHDRSHAIVNAYTKDVGGCKVFEYINDTDGDSLSYVQLDLGNVYDVGRISLVRLKNRVFNDTVIVGSLDGNFDRDSGNWSVIYNEDENNKYGFGRGKDNEYLEPEGGKEFTFKEIPLRYIRVYMNGNDVDDYNYIDELEVYTQSDKVKYSQTNQHGMLRESCYDEHYRLTDYNHHSPYVKYVDPKVLTVKSQSKVNRKGNHDYIDVRFVSSVPSINLDGLRFIIEILGDKPRIGYINTRQVYQTIVSALDNKVYFNKPHEVFDCSASKYFFVGKLNNIPTTDKNLKIKVTPCWLPCGGKENDFVKGTPRTFSVSELFENASQ